MTINDGIRYKIGYQIGYRTPVSGKGWKKPLFEKCDGVADEMNRQKNVGENDIEKNSSKILSSSTFE